MKKIENCLPFALHVNVKGWWR